MINYIVYTVIIIILVLMSIIAIKAMNRGIKAKQKINKEKENDEYRN